jgi:SOS response regulatory protein OraA/RecX
VIIAIVGFATPVLAYYGSLHPFPAYPNDLGLIFAGVAAALVEEALASVADWAALAREVRRRRFGPEPPADWKEKGRQARFLQYRGFSNDHIRSALGAEFDPGS